MSPGASPPARVTFYEVYEKRSLYEPLETLPVLDRDRDVKKALASARAWGGVVFKVWATVREVRPRLRRDIVAVELVFVHTARPTPLEPRDRITIKELKGQLRRHQHPHLHRKPRP